jgi:hypothetical protein
MRKIPALASIAFLAGAVSPAPAHDAAHRCAQGSASITADAMRTKIDELGYQVRRLHTDDGCFKASIVDRESGGTVKATFSATTGELVRARLGP